MDKILKLISSGESLIIDAVDGTETLADTKDVFAYIDPNFKNWGADAKEGLLATEETSVDVYRMIKDATFAQMFGKLNADTRKLCLTQHQIKDFAQKHRKWFCLDTFGTFFLFKSEGNFFVASVYYVGELGVGVCQFEDSHVWNARSRIWVVVPRLV